MQVRGKLAREKTLEKINRETDMLARLQNVPGVIRLLECFEDSENVDIITELCAGGDLQKYVEVSKECQKSGLMMKLY
jgi:serine/threonine protein kinase